MQSKRILKSIAIWFVALAMTVSALGQQKKPSTRDLSEEQLVQLERKALRVPSGPSFYIAPIQGTKDFSVLLTDANNRSMPFTFTPRQIDIFEALLVAGKDFALTDEAVGGGSPVTTRLMDKTDSTLAVDVAKVGNRSRVYVTLVGVHGQLTTDAGEITRGSKKEPAILLFKILSQVREAKEAKPLQ